MPDGLIAFTRSAQFVIALAHASNPTAPSLRHDHPYPNNHYTRWAHRLLAELRTDQADSSLGNKSPKRLSRYDVAVEIYSAYCRVQALNDRISRQIDDINAAITELQARGSGVAKADRDKLEARLYLAVVNVDRLEHDAFSVVTLALRFRRELSTVGVDPALILSTLKRETTSGGCPDDSRDQREPDRFDDDD